MSQTLFAAEGDSSSIIETLVNTTGKLDPILEIDPDDGTGLIFFNNPPVEGKKPGLPIYGDFRETDGNPLPTGSTLALAYQSPKMDSWSVVSIPIRQISAYNKNPISDQQDAEKIDAVKQELKGGQLQVRDVDTACLLLESTAQIDHSNSEIYFEPAAVDEVDTE